jgi:formylglycine-generating enzyme required for sulfatase activity
MHGNVWEWCQDWYGSYPAETVTDPVGPETGSYRVLRGSYRNFNGWCCRSANRNGNNPEYRGNDRGFRVVLAPGQPAQ